MSKIYKQIQHRCKLKFASQEMKDFINEFHPEVDEEDMIEIIESRSFELNNTWNPDVRSMKLRLPDDSQLYEAIEEGDESVLYRARVEEVINNINNPKEVFEWNTPSVKYKFIGTDQDLIDNRFELFDYIPNIKALKHNIVIDDENNVLYHQNNIRDLIDKGLVVEV